MQYTKNPRLKNYICWGVIALAVIALSAVFGFSLSQLELVSRTLGETTSISMPIMYEAVLTYLMLPIYNRARACTTLKLKTIMKSESAIGKPAKTADTLISLIVLFAIMAGLFSMIIPQICTSIIGLWEGIGKYISNLTLWMTELPENNPNIQQAIMPYYEQAMGGFQKWLTEKLIPNISAIIGQLSTGLLSVVTVVENILISVIVMVYFLNIKGTLATQFKETMYSVLRLGETNRIINEVCFARNVSGGFITDKLLDSLVTEIICLFALEFLKMPYVLLISIIIDVTNVIPFFGPLVGAILSAFPIPLISPMKYLYFLTLVLILQQLDGNILGPKIPEDSTGFPSFWVLFSTLLFGRLMGFVGMIIRVLAFVVICKLTSMYMSNPLMGKDLPSKTKNYLCLDHIDKEEKIHIDRDIQK